MDHVVVISNLFVLDQDIQVYKDGACVKTVKCKMGDIEKVCYNLCKEYDIHKISYHGIPQAGEKLQKELHKNVEFNDFQINVDLV